MAQLFNRTFFHFLIGFIALIALSFTVISATGYFADRDAQIQAQAQVEESAAK